MQNDRKAINSLCSEESTVKRSKHQVSYRDQLPCQFRLQNHKRTVSNILESYNLEERQEFNENIPQTNCREVRKKWGKAIEVKSVREVKQYWKWYKGMFRESSLSGNGRIAFRGGIFYQGAIENGLPHGLGRLSLKHGIVLLAGDWAYGDLVRQLK